MSNHSAVQVSSLTPPTRAVKRVETRAAVVWLDDHGILHCDIKDRTDLGLDDAREIIDAERSIAGGKRRPTLVDMAGTITVNREARMYFAGPETAAVETATALLISSPFTRAIGNFCMGLNKPIIPARLFTDQSEALSWLNGFLLD